MPDADETSSQEFLRRKKELDSLTKPRVEDKADEIRHRLQEMAKEEAKIGQSKVDEAKHNDFKTQRGVLRDRAFEELSKLGEDLRDPKQMGYESFVANMSKILAYSMKLGEALSHTNIYTAAYDMLKEETSLGPAIGALEDAAIESANSMYKKLIDPTHQSLKEKKIEKEKVEIPNLTEEDLVTCENGNIEIKSLSHDDTHLHTNGTHYSVDDELSVYCLVRLWLEDNGWRKEPDVIDPNNPDRVQRRGVFRNNQGAILTQATLAPYLVTLNDDLKTRRDPSTNIEMFKVQEIPTPSPRLGV